MHTADPLLLLAILALPDRVNLLAEDESPKMANVAEARQERSSEKGIQLTLKTPIGAN